MSIKKLSLVGLLIMGVGPILGMEPQDSEEEGGFFSSLLFEEWSAEPVAQQPAALEIKSEEPVTQSTAALEIKSAKLNAEFDKLIKDLKQIAEKIKNPTYKDSAKQSLDSDYNRFTTIIRISSKLEPFVREIYPKLQRAFNKEEENMLISALEEKFGPSHLQSDIINRMLGSGDVKMRGIYGQLYDVVSSIPFKDKYIEEKYYQNLRDEVYMAFNSFSSKDVGTLYNAENRPREKDVQTVPVEKISRKRLREE